VNLARAVIQQQNGTLPLGNQLIGELARARLRGLLPNVDVDGMRVVEGLVADARIEEGLKQSGLPGSREAGEPDDPTGH